MKKPTCYVLFSGGLDSRLALKSMQEQSENGKKFDIIAVYFHLPFLKEVREEIKEFCKDHGIKLEIFDYSKGDLFKKYIKMIEKPKFGYGVGINPCIDCHLFIINETKKMLNDNDFICTGEVLNERPMSQDTSAVKCKVVKDNKTRRARIN
jgi:tRNA U34 2-thiouridine synthase MnmA/TrmU